MENPIAHPPIPMHPTEPARGLGDDTSGRLHPRSGLPPPALAVRPWERGVGVFVSIKGPETEPGGEVRGTAVDRIADIWRTGWYREAQEADLLHQNHRRRMSKLAAGCWIPGLWLLTWSAPSPRPIGGSADSATRKSWPHIATSLPIRRTRTYGIQITLTTSRPRPTPRSRPCSRRCTSISVTPGGA